MIASSQISFSQNNTRQVSAMDASQLRIRQQAPAAQEPQTGASQRSLFRQAAYQYSSQEQLAFSSSSQVQGNDRTTNYTSAEFVEQSSELFLLGQQALTVSRAALGGDTVAEPQTSVSVQAGQYLFYSESETRNFASSGSITLESGESIDFTLSLRQSQSRSYEYSELVQIQERPMTDPLVINFGSTTAQLTDSLFEFDMNSDGKTGDFASLGSGSGYLVFDRNSNGKVDDGNNNGNGPVDARIAAMQKALEKLSEIREKQQAFIDASKDQGKEKSPLDGYMKIIDKLRLEMLNSQDEKKQAASRYLEFARL